MWTDIMLIICSIIILISSILISVASNKIDKQERIINNLTVENKLLQKDIDMLKGRLNE